MSTNEYRHKIFRFWSLYATGACTVLGVALEITNGLNALAVVTGVIGFSLFLWNCYYAYRDLRMNVYRHKLFQCRSLCATGACTALPIALGITNGRNALAVATAVIWYSL